MDKQQKNKVSNSVVGSNMNNIRTYGILCFCLIAFPLFLKAQSAQTYKSKDTVDVTHSVYSHFSDIRIEPEQVPLEFTFDTITKSQFDDFKRKYTPQIDTSSNAISMEKSSFQLIASDTAFHFGCENPRPCHNYHGYYSDLDSYLIGVSGDGIYETFLISRQTALGLPIPAFFDGSGSNPLISPDKKRMLIYGTCGVDPEYCLKYYPYASVLAIVEISSKNQIEDLKTYKIFETKDWVIDEVVWVDGKTIAIRLCDEDCRGEEPKNMKYFRATIQ